MSIAGGMPLAVERATRVGATALQVFVKSSNQWAARPFDRGEPEAFRAATAAAGIDGHVVAHASYLINVASPDEALWSKSVAALGVELDRCAALGIPWLVLHPGSPKDSGREEGIRRTAQALDAVVGGGAGVLLENTAGQGNVLGGQFEDLGAIVAAARCRDRLGVCFDTCHAFAAGYELRDATSFDRTMGRLDAAVGLSRLRAFHLNDSKGGFGSRLDRHEHIGRGQLGLEAFRRILRDRRFRDLPMLLETPKGDDLEEDRVNLAVLLAMAAP
jgi:deoxyribonuclease-4